MGFLITSLIHVGLGYRFASEKKGKISFKAHLHLFGTVITFPHPCRTKFSPMLGPTELVVRARVKFWLGTREEQPFTQQNLSVPSHFVFGTRAIYIHLAKFSVVYLVIFFKFVSLYYKKKQQLKTPITRESTPAVVSTDTILHNIQGR